MILEVMNQEVFVKAREAALKEARKKTLPTADIADASPGKETLDKALKAR